MSGPIGPAPPPGFSPVTFPVFLQCEHCASFTPGPRHEHRTIMFRDESFSLVIQHAALIALAGQDFQRHLIDPANHFTHPWRHLRDTTQMSDHLERVFGLRLRLDEDFVRDESGTILEAATEEHLRQKTAAIRPTPRQLAELILIASEQNESVKKAVSRGQTYLPLYANIGSVVQGPHPTYIGVFLSRNQHRHTPASMDSQEFRARGTYHATGYLFQIGHLLLAQDQRFTCVYCY